MHNIEMFFIHMLLILLKVMRKNQNRMKLSKISYSTVTDLAKLRG